MAYSSHRKFHSFPPAAWRTGGPAFFSAPLFGTWKVVDGSFGSYVCLFMDAFIWVLWVRPKTHTLNTVCPRPVSLTVECLWRIDVAVWSTFLEPCPYLLGANLREFHYGQKYLENKQVKGPTGRASAPASIVWPNVQEWAGTLSAPPSLLSSGRGSRKLPQGTQQDWNF